MDNKIYEEAMTNIIRRIEALEEFNKIYYSNQQHPKQFQSKQGTSTPGQLGYIKKLGGKADSSMSKQEASNEIDRLLQKQRDGEPEEECESVEEPKEVDTDDAGLEGDLM